MGVGESPTARPTFDSGKYGKGSERPIDKVDFRILAALHQNGLLSHAALGRNVGLTAPAVRARMDRLRAQKVLQGFRAALHPALFGKTSTLYVLPGPHTDRDRDQALAIEGVIWVAVKVDGGLTVMAYDPCRSALEKLGEVAHEIPGDGRAPAEPGRIGRKILTGIIGGPRDGRDVLARRTRLSPKTVAKHRGRMIEHGLLDILPLLGPLRGEGTVVYHVAVFGRTSAKNVGRVFGEAILVNETPHVQYWFCRADNLEDVLNRQNRAGDLPDVERVRITLNRELRQNDTRLKQWLDSPNERQVDP